MKIILFLTLISLNPLAQAASLADVSSCLTHFRQNQDPSKGHEIINHCYDMALPWATSSSLQEKSLYIQALQGYLRQGADWFSFQAMTEKLVDYYRLHIDADINTTSLTTLNDSDLQAAFEAVSAVEFYSSKIFVTDIALDKFSMVFEALEQRHLATSDQAYSVYSAFLTNGQWDKARQIQARWPELSSSILPVVTGSQTLSPSDLGYYTISSDLKTMTLSKFDEDHGPKVIMSGYCHFAIDVVLEIEKDPELSMLMKQHGVVIIPNYFNDIDFQKIDALRKNFPEFEFHPVLNSGAWFSKGINTLSSPTILFFLDGKPLYEIPGVNKYLHSEFCTGFERIGLPTPASCSKHILRD